jgi:hypothetical protein
MKMCESARVRKVAILIPASPVEGFLSQIAAFSLALRRLNWLRWQPAVHVFLGGDIQPDVLREWRRHLRDVALVLVPPSVTDTETFFYGQIDSCIRWAPSDADVLIRMDADTLPVDDLEDVLDYVAYNHCVAGVIAHALFPTWAGLDSRHSWYRAARGLITHPIRFEHAYSMAGDYMAGQDPSTPFYLNDGVVFLARSIFSDFAECYLRLRPKLMDRLVNPYFAGQIALTLAVAETGLRTCALPMRYNFPNDELAGARYPEELRHVKVIHYLRNHHYMNRQRIFASEQEYARFLGAPLTGANAVFRQRVTELLGAEYPFAPGPQAGARSPSVPAGSPPEAAS